MEMEDRAGGVRRERLHRRVWELLPWYVNATLAPAEQRTVEEHLAGCERCRAEAERCREAAAAVAAAEEMAPSPHPVQLARLMARIEEAEAAASPAAPPAGGALGSLSRLLRSTPTAVRFLVAAQAAALLLATGALLRRGGEALAPAPPATFRTLSDADAGEAAPAMSGARLRVLFAEGAAEREVNELLAAVRGQIVSGPSPIGAFVVVVPTGPGADPLPMVLAHLRSRPQVTFAEPVAGAAERPAAGDGGR